MVIKVKKVAVIGGGASGLMAAVAAAENGAEVTVFERNDRVGKKILATGNGKCNFSNKDFHNAYYNGEYTEKLSCFFERFSVQDTLAFFESAGMLWKEKNGYLYPLSEQASTVLDIFRLKLRQLLVKVELQQKVKSLKRDGSTFRLVMEETGQRSGFDAVILACGGCAAPKTGSDGNGYRLAKMLGHRVTETMPALVQLRCREEFFKSVAGVRCEASISLGDEKHPVRTERGELQFTDYGISGIPVFQLSGKSAFMLKRQKEVPLYIDLFPDYGKYEYEDMCQKRMGAAKGRNAEEFLLGMANKKINLAMLKLAGIKPTEAAADIPMDRLQELLYSYRRLCVHATAPNSWEHAQVSAGGVSMKEVSECLESLLAPGVYFAGELLDIDGRCGGYNLQWAWTSGYIAGKAAALNNDSY